MELIEEQRLKQDALSVFRELVRRWGLDLDEFFALHHRQPEPRHPRWMIRYEVWCDYHADEANAEELNTMKRMQLFRDRLRERVAREAALEEVLRTFPK
jgi:hypothetical protein